MINLIVHVDVKPEFKQEFIDATELARDGDVHEIGCILYTLHQDVNNQNAIVLGEGYMNQEPIEDHKTRPHFLKWRTDVENMMASPRKVTRLNLIQTSILK